MQDVSEKEYAVTGVGPPMDIRYDEKLGQALDSSEFEIEYTDIGSLKSAVVATW